MLVFALLGLFVLSVQSDCTAIPTAQACAEAGGPTTCSTTREVCDKRASGANTDICRDAGDNIAVGGTNYRLCLDACDCSSNLPRCAPLAAADGTTVCQGCLSNSNCTAWIASDDDRSDSERFVCNRLPAGDDGNGNVATTGNCDEYSTVSYHNAATPFSYTTCSRDKDCQFASAGSEGEYSTCMLTTGDFRPLTSALTTVCGCLNNADCSRLGQVHVCDLTYTLNFGTASTPITVRAPGTCRPPKALTFDSTATSQRQLCYNGRDCPRELAKCANYTTTIAGITLDTTTCQSCTVDADCASHAGQVCHLSAVTVGNVNVQAGQCYFPQCTTDNDCADPQASFCSNPGTSQARCIGCHASNHCSAWPAAPWCTSDDSAAPGHCTEGCYTDGNCADGFRCLDNACVECITGNDCYSRNQTKPICSATNECVFCTEDTECLSQFPLFEACHVEMDEFENQTKGECVQDTYQKGFQVAAIVLGSLGVFLVIIALLVAVMAFTKSD